MRRLAASSAAFVALTAGCGGGTGSSAGPPTVEPGAAAARALREAGTFRFRAAFTRTRSDAPDRPETYMTAEGAVDLGAGAGRTRLALAGLVALETFDEPVELEWGRDDLAARIGGRLTRMPRSEARERGGLIGRFPDEPAGLVGLLAEAGGGARLGSEIVDGRELAGYRFPVELRTAGAAGVPVELSRAFSAGAGARSFAVEAWLDAKALPRRLGYVVALDEVRSDGKLLLPARTVRVTYELSSFGEPVASGQGPG